MSERVVELDKQLSEMSFGDLCLLCGQAINMKMDRKRIEILLKYLEIAMLKWKLKEPKDE